jgi:hypothetical protein
MSTSKTINLSTVEGFLTYFKIIESDFSNR